jgi:threonine dehydratase
MTPPVRCAPAGSSQTKVEPQTIADGVRTVSVGQHNWAVLREGLAGIIEVSEEHIREAVRLLFTLAISRPQPTGALAVAAVLAASRRSSVTGPWAASSAAAMWTRKCSGKSLLEAISTAKPGGRESTR